MILGKISALTEGEGVTLIVDGETEPTTKKYMFLSSYQPEADDRVLIEEISDTYVVIGKVVESTEAVHVTTADYATNAGTAQSATKATQDGEGNNIRSTYGNSLSLGATPNIVQIVSASGTVLSSVTVNREEEAQGVKNWCITSFTSYPYSIEFKTDVTGYNAATKLYWRARSDVLRGSWKLLANG